VQTSPLIERHRAAGARLAGSRPLTFGDVPGEYRAGREGALLLDATERGALRAEGSEAESFLHRLTSNSVRGLEPGAGCRDLLLSSKGKVLFDFDLSRTARGFFLSTPPGAAQGLLEALELYHFSEDVAFADATEGHAPLEIVGPEARACLAAVLATAPPLELHRSIEVPRPTGPVVVSAVDVAGERGWRLDAGPAGAARLWSELSAAGARPGGIVARDSLRVEACRAEWGRDVDDNVYPQEARLEDAFSLDKGCYIGQEVVAKIDTYGGLNKLLFPLAVDHEDPVAAGTRLLREQDGEWRDLGVVTSWAWSFALDTGLVLGYVKRKHQDPGTTFRLGEGPGRARLIEPPVRPARS